MHISVVIPTFNRAHLVSATIESILNQVGFSDFDLLIVDDCSTDDTISVVKKYVEADPRVKLVVNEQNLGLTKNWNRCLDLAHGPLVQLVQSDDLIDPGYMGAVSNIFEKYPSVGIVAATCRYIDAGGNVIGTNPVIESRLYKAGDEAAIAFIQQGYPHVSSIVVRRECYEKLGKYDEAIWHGPDMEFDVRLASKYPYFRFGEVYTSFRRHGTNMGDLEFMRKDFLEVDHLKRKKTLSYLSSESLKQLGIIDLDRYVASISSRAAVGGSIAMIGHGRTELARFYLREAIRLAPREFWRINRFWRALVLNLFPPLGTYVMSRRMKISHTDRKTAQAVDRSLKAQREFLP